MNKLDFNNIFAKKKLFFYGILIAIILAIFDLFSKKIIFEIIDKNYLQNGSDYIEILPFFNLVKVWNNGVSFGMFNSLENSQIIFSILVSAISLFIIFWLYRNQEKYMMIALSLILGGAIGNLSDRIHNGAVADFLDFYAFGYHWPAFNLADSYVFIGVFMLIIDDFLLKNKKR